MTVRQKADQAEVEARTRREMLAARERRIAAGPPTWRRFRMVRRSGGSRRR